jgi:hypothetical protein
VKLCTNVSQRVAKINNKNSANNFASKFLHCNNSIIGQNNKVLLRMIELHSMYIFTANVAETASL